MRHLFLFLALAFSVSIIKAQTPIEVVFKKYSNKNGVEISTENIPVKQDSAIKYPLSVIEKTLTIKKNEDDEYLNKLCQKIAKDCEKIVKRKSYTLVSIDRDDNSYSSVYKLENKNVTEICEIEQDENEFTLTVTRMLGFTKEMKENLKIDIKKIKG